MTTDWYINPYGISKSEAIRRKGESVEPSVLGYTPPVANNNGAKLLENVDFRNFVAQKYYEKDNSKISLDELTDSGSYCSAPSPTLWDKPKSQTEKDYEEYQKYLGIQDNYMKTFGKVNPIHATLAIDLKSAGNDYATSMAKISKMDNVEEAKLFAKQQEKIYNQKRKQILLNHNISEEELNRYESSLIRPWGLTQEVLYDIPGVLAKQWLITLGLKAIGGTVGGAANIVLAKGVGLPAAVASGAETGALIGESKLGFALAVMWDTYDKEKGWYIADQFKQNPGMTDKEFRLVKTGGALAGAVNGAVEATSDAFAYVPVLKNISAGLPLKKITSKYIKESIDTVAKNSIKKETIKSFFKGAAIEGGEEVIQGRVSELLNNWVAYYGVAEKNEELDRFPNILQKGNIDLMDRPQAKMPDGSIATVRSMAFTTENGVILLPSVKHDGKILTDPKDVWGYYQMTGEFLGKFKNKEDADEYANLVHEQQARLLNYVSGSEMITNSASDFIVGAQPALLMGGVLGTIRRSAGRHAKQAANYNEKVEAENIKNGYTDPKTQEVNIGKPVNEEGQPIYQGKVTEEVNLSEQTTEQLDKSEAESQIRLNELDKDIATAETKLANAKALGLTEQEKESIQKDLDFSKQQREELSDYRKSLGTEKAIRQAEEETNKRLEEVNAQLEKANAQLENAQSKIETATGKALKKAVETVSKLNYKIQEVLEPKQQKLLEDLNKIQTRTDIESVLKGKKTTIASTTLVKSEKKAERDILKVQESLNKQTKKTVEAKLNGAIKALKSFYQGQAQGFKQGVESQRKETKDVRNQLRKILRESGIKKKEMSVFDSIAKNIITTNDLEKAKGKIKNKVEEVLEERNREIGRRVIGKLRERIKLYKKNPASGKFTAEIQKTLNRIFEFTKKSVFEAGLDLRAILNQSPEIAEEVESRKLTEEQQRAILKTTTEKDIIDLQQQKNELEKQAKKDKKKWEGRNKNREDVITDVESAVKSYEYQKEPQEAEKPTANFIKNIITKSLNFLNMGIRPNDLKIMVESSALQDIMLSNKGELEPTFCKLYVRSESKYTIPHEIGHYLDRKLGEIFGLTESRVSEGEYFSNSEIFENLGNRAKNIKEKFDKIVQSEINRFKKNAFLNKIVPAPGQQYFLSPKEIFAKVFEATYYKFNGITVEASINPTINEIDNYFVKFVPDQTINDMISLLNDIAQYQAYGKQLDDLDLQIDELEKNLDKYENEKIGSLTPEERAGLPKDMERLAYEIELAHDIENRSFAEMSRFIDYVGNLIETGRDIRQEKIDAKKERDNMLVSQAIESIQGDNPIDVGKEYTPEEYEAKQKELTKTSFKKWVNQCAKAVLRFVQKPTNTWATLVDTLCQDDKNSVLAKVLDYVPALREYYKQRLEYAQKFNNILSEIYGVKVNSENEIEDLVISQSKPFQMTRILLTNGNYTDMTLTKQEAITAWMYLQNEDVRGAIRDINGIDTESFESNLLNFLTEKDIQFANKLFDLLDEYYGVVNSFFEEKYFVTMPKVQKYTPLVREQEIGAPEDIGRYNIQSLYASNPSSFKSRKRSNKPVLFKPVNELVNNHIEETSFAMAYDDFNRIGAKVLTQAKDIIEAKYGKKFYGLVVNQFKGISNPAVFGKLRDFVTTLFRNMSSASIGYNVTSAMKQIMSFPVLGLELSPTEFAAGIADFTSLSLPEMIKKGQFLFDNSPILQERYKNLNIELAMIAKDKKAARIWVSKQWSRLQNNMYILTRYGDTLNTIIGGWANYHAGLKRGLSHAEAMGMVERAVLKYNQSSNVEDQTVLQLKGGIYSAVTMFKSDTMKLYNAQVATLRNYLKGNISAAECAKRTVILTTNNLMSLLVDTAGVPTKREFLATVLIGQLASLPVFGEFISELTVTAIASLMQNFGDGDDDDDDRKPFFDKEGYLIDPTVNIAKFSYNLWLLQEKGFDKYEDNWWKAYEDFGEPMIKTWGIPSKPIKAVHSLTDSDVDDTIMMRLPTLIWTRRTLQSSYPDIYENN